MHNICGITQNINTPMKQDKLPDFLLIQSANIPMGLTCQLVRSHHILHPFFFPEINKNHSLSKLKGLLRAPINILINPMFYYFKLYKHVAFVLRIYLIHVSVYCTQQRESGDFFRILQYFLISGSYRAKCSI